MATRRGDDKPFGHDVQRPMAAGCLKAVSRASAPQGPPPLRPLGLASPTLLVVAPYDPVLISRRRLGKRARVATTASNSRESMHSPILCTFCSMPTPIPIIGG
jgi:hypothetical protein